MIDHEVQMNFPHVDIVIVSYNGRHNLEYSLPSIVGQEYPDFDVYVADNASSDGTAEWLARNYPNVHRIPVGANIGMSAMNLVLSWPKEQGIDKNAKYVFVAGWDLVFDVRCLAHAIETMEENEDIGVLGFEVLGLFEWVDLSELNRASAALDQKTIRDVNWVPGACSVFRRSALDALGFIDPEYFAYAEEDDVQFRFRSAGYRTVLINTPTWQNSREASIPARRASYLAMRNQIRFAFKNQGLAQGAKQMVRVALAACGPERADPSIRVNRRTRPYTPARNLPIVAAAWWWNITQLPQTLNARREMLHAVDVERRRRASHLERK